MASLSIGLTNVIVSSLIRHRFRDRMGLMTAAYTTSLAIGAGLGAALTVPVRVATGSLTVALGIWALPAVAALLLWAPQTKGASPPERDEVAVAAHPGPFNSPTARCVTQYFGLQSWVFYALMSWIPVIYRGMGAETAGVLLAVVNVAGVAGNFAAVPAGRARDQRPIVVAVVALVMVGVVGVMAGPQSLAVLWAVLVAVGTAAAFSIALLLVVVRSADPAVASRLSSMTQSVGYLVAGTGPFALGLLHAASGGWTLPLVLMLGVVAAELVTGVFAGRPRLVTADGKEAILEAEAAG